LWPDGRNCRNVQLKPESHGDVDDRGLIGDIAMADDPNIRGGQDRSRINIHQDHELRYWSQKFGVTPEKLKAAVQKVGVSAKDVEQELSGRG
jgi:hypothetical protein